MKSARFGALARPLLLVLVGVSVVACSGPGAAESVEDHPRSAALQVATVPTAAVRGIPHIMKPMAPDEAEALRAKRSVTKDKLSVTGGPDPRLAYFGGPIIANVIVVAVDWTSSVDPVMSAYLPDFYTSIVGPGSPYFSWLAEYGTVGLKGASDGDLGSNQPLGFGTFDTTGSGPGGTYVISPANTSMNLADSDVSTELVAQIAAGHLPAPTLDALGNVNTLYMIDFPAGYTTSVEQGGTTVYSCTGFCGYHNTVIYDGADVVPYGVLPDQSAASACHTGCGSSKNYINNSTSSHSHELVEALTDTAVGIAGGGFGRPLAWYDATDTMGGESADLCNQIQYAIPFASAPMGTYTVQEIWSNNNGACIAVPPICNGTSSPPSCTPCTAADDGVACAGATPVCETNSASPVFAQCVQCLTSATCGALTCDPGTDTCQCAHDSQCTDPTPVCSGASHACVACKENADCAGNAAGQVCSEGSCVECAKDSDCKAPETCNLLSDTCESAGGDAGTDGSTPPVDSGRSDSGPIGAKDSGARDAAKADAGSGTSGGGCAAAPQTTHARARDSAAWLLGAGLVVVARRRRRR
jgi:hypothetical protein